MSQDSSKHATMFTLTEDPMDQIFAFVNRFLTIIFLILITYILWTPFFGEVVGVWRKSVDKTGGYVYQSSFAREMIKKGLIHTTSNDLKAIPTANTLVIPKINVDAPILDGSDSQTLNRGFWRRPKTSSPDKGGNTVITGHRFLYTSGPNTFYDLNKVVKGDDIIVYWGGKEYSYRVNEVKVVEPEDIGIEESSIDPVLTLYTCTPLWTSKQRLVVRALPVKL